MNSKKDEIARELAQWHSRTESAIQKIIRLRSQNEDSNDEPIKLLELNTATVPTGITPVSFGASPDAPFPSIVIELTGEEFDKVLARKLSLPDDWTIGETLFERNS